MAIFFDAPVSPAALTAFVRRVPVPADNILVPAFPARQVNGNTIDFAEIVRTNRTARYRSFDGSIHVSARDAGSEKRVALLPLSDSLNKGEYERLQEEFARTMGTNKELLASAIYNDGERLTYHVYNRLEQAWGDVLNDGILTINENGFQGEADFGVPTNHKVTAATLWTNIAAPALSDIIGWNDVWTATNGGPAGAMRVPLRISRLLQINTQIVGAVHGSASGKTRVTIDEINGLLSAEGCAPLVVQKSMHVDVDGVDTATLADNRIWLTPENLGDLGYTAWGTSATALELVRSPQVEFLFSAAPGLVGVVEKVGPPYREFSFIDAVAMPILEQAKKLFIAIVAA